MKSLIMGEDQGIIDQIIDQINGEFGVSTTTAKDILAVAATKGLGAWGELVKQLSTYEREKFEIFRKAEKVRVELEAKIDNLIVERTIGENGHAREIMVLKATTEKQVRDAVNKLRRDVYLCDERRKKAETRAKDARMRRTEAEKTVWLLQLKLADLKREYEKKQGDSNEEIARLKGERDASYNRTQEHAEERVKAMCDLARNAQDAMYRNMEHLENERSRLTLREKRQTELGIRIPDLDGEIEYDDTPYYDDPVVQAPSMMHQSSRGVRATVAGGGAGFGSDTWDTIREGSME